MSELTVTRWKRYGHDRVYVSDSAGVRIGYACLKTGAVVPDDPSLSDQVEAAVARFRVDTAGIGPQGAASDAPAAQQGDVDPKQPDAGSRPAAPQQPAASGFAVGPLTVNRWTKHGFDRAYVHGPDGARLGYGCLLTGVVRIESDGDGGRVEAAVATFRVEHGIHAPERAPSSTAARELAASTVASEEPWSDLVNNRPGQGVAQQAAALRAESPLATRVDRLFGVRSEERAWRIGAKGEQRVAQRLAELPPSWRVLHSVPVGKHGADVDHVVMGPGGVFTVNAKNHPNARVWVGGSTLLINGHRTDYVTKSIREAQRATRLLSAKLAFPVTVHGIVALAGCHKGIEIKSQPRLVHVTGAKKLPGWLTGLGTLLTPEQVEAIFESARRSTTWTGTAV